MQVVRFWPLAYKYISHLYTGRINYIDTTVSSEFLKTTLPLLQSAHKRNEGYLTIFCIKRVTVQKLCIFCEICLTNKHFKKYYNKQRFNCDVCYLFTKSGLNRSDIDDLILSVRIPVSLFCFSWRVKPGRSHTADSRLSRSFKVIESERVRLYDFLSHV